MAGGLAQSAGAAPGAANSTAALVLAAGRGLRFGGRVPKAFVELRGRSLLERSLRALCAVAALDPVVPVVAGEDLPRYRALDLAGLCVGEPVPGGERRQDSVLAGVRSLPGGTQWVAVHDGARCLVTPAEVAAVVAAARETGAAILAHPCGDTIKRVRAGWIVETPERETCWAAQTPQVFRRDLLLEALEKARAEGFEATDDAQLVERLGVRVRVVQGRESNVKITHPGDLAVAEAWLARRDSGEDA